MSIFVDENTKVIVPGPHRWPGQVPRPAQPGLRHPGRGRRQRPARPAQDVEGIPSSTPWPTPCGHRRQRQLHHRPPRRRASAAILEAANAWHRFIVCITEGIPAQDEAWFYNKLKRDFPNTFACSARTARASSAPESATSASPPARSPSFPRFQGPERRHREPLRHAHVPGALRAQAAGHRRHHLRRHRWRPRARAPTFIDCLSEAFEADPDTKAVMMIGEIGGSAEEEAAEFIKTNDEQAGRAPTSPASPPLPARRWAMPAPSSRVARAPRQAQDGGAARTPACEVGKNPTEAGELMAGIVAKL